MRRENRSTFGVAMKGITVTVKQDDRKKRKASGGTPAGISGAGQVPTHTEDRGLSTLNKSDEPELKPVPVAQEPQTAEQIENAQAKEQEERKRRLREEREQLVTTISKLEERNRSKKVDLESLQEMDETEKWEDDLLKMRLEELQNARTLIGTHSSTKNQDIRHYINELNEKLSTAALHTAKQAARKEPQGSLEEISKILGSGLLDFFPRSKTDRPMDLFLTKAFVQIFLTRSCAMLLNSWNLKLPKSGHLINSMYEYVRSTEEQMVASKWRQFTFAEVPHGTKTTVLQDFVKYKSKGVVDILSCAGWEADTEKISHRVWHLMMKTEYLRIHIRSAVIFADYLPRIAAHDVEFDSSTMMIDNNDFGGERVRSLKGCHVLGSTGLGWKVGDDVKWKTRVLLVESFRNRLRPQPNLVNSGLQQNTNPAS